MEPQEIVENHIDKIVRFIIDDLEIKIKYFIKRFYKLFFIKRKELTSLRQIKDDSLSADLFDDVDLQEIDPLIDKKISELDRMLNIFYSSMDGNNGMLEDVYLIP